MPRNKKTKTPEEENISTQPEAPPPPLFLGQKERDLVKQVNDELIERVIGQTIVYYPISREYTEYNLYGESIKKTFLNPVKVQALINWEKTKVTTDVFGVDRVNSLTIHFHKRRLTEDQDLYVRIGDYVLYGKEFYEIVNTIDEKLLFGQVDNLFEISAKCIRARESVFNSK
jgi:hypothetical protein